MSGPFQYTGKATDLFNFPSSLFLENPSFLESLEEFSLSARVLVHSPEYFSFLGLQEACFWSSY